MKYRSHSNDPSVGIPRDYSAVRQHSGKSARMICAASVALIAGVFGSMEAQAATYYWDSDAAATAATGGTGNWDTASSLWRAGSSTGTLTTWPAVGGDNDAILGGTAGTLTLITGISVNDITVAPTSGTAYTITGATQTLTLNGTAQSVLDVASGSTLTITSGLVGLNGFTKSSAGTLILDSAAGTDTLFGSIAVNGGTLQAGTATNNGASQVLRSNAVTLAGGTSLTTVGTTIDLRVGSLSGSGSVTPATGGAINEFALVDATFSGTITASGGLNLRGANTTQTFTGNVSALAGTVGISGVSLGSGSTSTGLTLSGSSALTGATTNFALRGGTLTLDNTGGNTGAGAATDRMLDSGAITTNGGTLSLLGNGTNGSSESAGGLTLNAGAATIGVTHNGGSGGTVLTLASFVRTSGVGATINFTGSGGTLGTAGANPRIIFTAAPGLTNSVIANSAASTKVGFATVNGTDFAGYDNTLGVVPVSTTAISGTLTTATTQNSLLNASGTISSASNVGYNTLKILAGSGATLSLSNTGNLTSKAILLAGTDDFTIQNTGGATSGLGGGDDRFLFVSNAATTLNVGVTLTGSQQNVVKSGDGFLTLTGTTNQLGFTATQKVVVAGGVLRGTLTNLGGGTSAGGAFTTIQMRGGTLELSGGGTFTRAIDLAGTLAGGGITFDEGAAERGNGGFSAVNGNAVVTLVTSVAGATAASLVWNDNAFLSNGYVLIMGSTKADGRVDLTNNIGLDDGTATNNYFGREIRVTDNTSSSTDVARLSGIISGSANADLVKTGGGMLELTGANTYSGSTLIRQGTLAAGGGGAIPNSSAVVLANALGAAFQLNASETIGTLAGGGATGGNVNIQGNTLTMGDQRDSTFAGVISGTGGAVVKQGAGVIALTGANTFTGGTTLSAGTLIAGNDSALGSTGAQAVTFNGGRLASDNDARSLPNNLTVNNVAGNQITGTNSVTLTGTAGGTGTLEVALTNPAKSFTVNPATANSFAPDMLRLTSGTLLLGGSNKIGDATKMNFNGGRLGLNNFSEGSAGTAGLGAMTLSASSTLDYGTLGAGANLVEFGGVGTHTAATALQVTNYDVGSDHLYFTGATSDFTSAFGQNEVSFNGTSGYAAISFGSYYEIVAVPEPATIFGAMGLLGFIVWRERRRARGPWGRAALLSNSRAAHGVGQAD